MRFAKSGFVSEFPAHKVFSPEALVGLQVLMPQAGNSSTGALPVHGHGGQGPSGLGGFCLQDLYGLFGFIYPPGHLGPCVP